MTVIYKFFFYTNFIFLVLQKWASEEGEIQEEDIRRAASNYAKLEINNKILKWIIMVVIVFLFVLLGFMIASVVIGVNITKDITVKDGVLVSNSGNNAVLKTSTVTYKNKISVNSPIEVIESMKSISINVQEGLYFGVVQFDVVSFEFIPGKKLTFHGHTHMAVISQDGSVEYQPLIPFSQERATPVSSGGAIEGESTSSGASEVLDITTCQDFKNIQPQRSYRLLNDLQCGPSDFSLPLFSDTFSGVLDGQFHVFNYTGLSSTSKTGIFDVLQGTVKNLMVAGVWSGKNNCGVVATTARAPSFITKVGSYVTLNCEPTTAAGNAGGLVAKIEKNPLSDSDRVKFTSCISQQIITNTGARSGGLYGYASDDVADCQYNAIDTTFQGTAATGYLGIYASSTRCPTKENFLLMDSDLTADFQFPVCSDFMKASSRTPAIPNDQNADSNFRYLYKQKTEGDNVFSVYPSNPDANTCSSEA